MFLVQLALAALVAVADPAFDTVFLQNGGRLRGVVIEEDPKVSVTIQLPTGELRKLPAAEVLRIEYREAPVPGAAAPAATAPAAAAPRGEVPAAEATAAPTVGEVAGQLLPGRFTVALGLGWAHAIGGAAANLAMADLTKPQFALDVELGLRIIPSLTLSFYADGGFGGTSMAVQNVCRGAGFACDAVSSHYGGLLRYAFTPGASRTAWIAVGSGSESTEIAASDVDLDVKLVTFSGWEWVRLSAGYDDRGNGFVGFGLYVKGGVGRYTTVEDATGRRQLASPPVHGWIELGARVIIWP